MLRTHVLRGLALAAVLGFVMGASDLPARASDSASFCDPGSCPGPCGGGACPMPCETACPLEDASVSVPPGIAPAAAPLAAMHERFVL